MKNQPLWIRREPDPEPDPTDGIDETERHDKYGRIPSDPKPEQVRCANGHMPFDFPWPGARQYACYCDSCEGTRDAIQAWGYRLSKRNRPKEGTFAYWSSTNYNDKHLEHKRHSRNKDEGLPYDESKIVKGSDSRLWLWIMSWLDCPYYGDNHHGSPW